MIAELFLILDVGSDCSGLRPSRPQLWRDGTLAWRSTLRKKCSTLRIPAEADQHSWVIPITIPV
jgi:hypothetical protein